MKGRKEVEIGIHDDGEKREEEQQSDSLSLSFSDGSDEWHKQMRRRGDPVKGAASSSWRTATGCRLRRVLIGCLSQIAHERLEVRSDDLIKWALGPTDN